MSKKLNELNALLGRHRSAMRVARDTEILMRETAQQILRQINEVKRDMYLEEMRIHAEESHVEIKSN